MKSDYHKHDHVHCWESKKPPCGQKIKHLECCLCLEKNPEVKRLINAAREKEYRRLISVANINYIA